jgi:UDP-N-acetylmuramoyl-tripeptide--D-alanyl-D-alanine ligase
MARVLSKKYKLFATQGNFNNHIGVPLSLLSLRNEEMAIIEMGANHQFEIDELCRIADPDFGIITNIGKAHLEGFGSFEAVVKTKTELYRYLDRKNGVVLINGNNPVLTDEVNKTGLEQYSYFTGKNLLCDGYIKSDGLFLSLVLKFTGSNEILVSTKLTGDYNLENILAAACAGKYFGVEESDIVDALESYVPSNNRSQFFSTDKNTLILDSYNANPASMTGAITNFLRIDKTPKMMILGDMLELGEWTEEEHIKILLQLKAAGFDNVHLVGKLFSTVVENFHYPVYENVENLIEHFRLNPVSNNLILLKGSRGIKLERLLEVL